MKKANRNMLFYSGIYSSAKKTAIIRIILAAVCILTFLCVAPISVAASSAEQTTTEDSSDDLNLNADSDGVTFYFNTGEGNGSLSSTLQILLVLTVISLAPSLLIMLTSFIRIIVVLHFVRSALGTQTTPPNQVLIGLALFLTFFIMSPTFSKINTEAVQPLSAGEISQEEAIDKGMQPIRGFMLNQFDQDNPKDIQLFLDIAGIGEITTLDEIPITVLIPAFIIHELRAAFIIGFLIYIPFLIIDMVVASTLMSMGMMMLPPTTISMPFKILLFIMADGWNLVIGQVIKTFY